MAETKKINDGGPAYPTRVFKDRFTGELLPYQLGNDGFCTNGMSLRDYFAAKAMQGMLAVPDDQRYGDRADKTLSVEQWQQWCVSGVVEHAYRVADAMIRARTQEQQPITGGG